MNKNVDFCSEKTDNTSTLNRTGEKDMILKNLKPLTEMTGPELVAAYNDAAKILDEPLVTRFASRAAGVERVKVIFDKVLKHFEQTKPKAKAEEVYKDVYTEDDNCPHCGITLSNGMRLYSEDIDDRDPLVHKAAKEHTHEYECMACHGYFGPKIHRRHNPKNHGAAIAKTWQDEAVKAKRITRNGVKVDGKIYRSVRQAFVELDLPLKMHIKFRMELKEAQSLEWADKKWEII
jgi:hypothetical protein